MITKIIANLFVLLVFCAAVADVAAQSPAKSAEQSNIVKVNLSQSEIDRIIQTFSAKERDFLRALNEYNFRREARIQSIGFGGQVSGEYRRDSLFIFDEAGTSRGEKVLFAPLSTLKEFNITPEDIQDLNGVNQFALEPAKINLYNINFVGKEKIDELNLFVFDVEPKVMPDPKKVKERLFQGRIWVDDNDLQIVRARGKGVPEDKNNKYPVIDTWRENIDGKYWFPTYSYGNGEFEFGSGEVVRYKMKIVFKDYAKARTDVKILEVEGEDELVDETKPTPPADKPKTDKPQEQPKKP